MEVGVQVVHNVMDDRIRRQSFDMTLEHSAQRLGIVVWRTFPIDLACFGIEESHEVCDAVTLVVEVLAYRLIGFGRHIRS